MIMVNIAQIKIATPPDQLCALGLGSCVGVVLYDPEKQIGGMIHVLLPTAADVAPGAQSNRAKFANPGLLDLCDMVVKAGARRNKLLAKLAGGAAVLASTIGTTGAVGERNAEECLRMLQELQIPVVGRDLGGNIGRSVYFDPSKNILCVKKIIGGESQL